MEFSGKTALITGGSTGIGLALGIKLQKLGAKVISFSISQPEEKIPGIDFIKVDITKRKSIQKALNKIKNIDILVNNAAIMRRGKIFESLEKDWDDIFSVNLKAQWLLTKLALPKLSNKASIIFVSSIHGVKMPKNLALYGLTKKALFHLADIIKQTYPNYSIKIAGPGPVETQMAHQGLTKEQFKKVSKKTKRETPNALAKKIIELIASKKNKLLFNPKTNNYYFESN